MKHYANATVITPEGDNDYCHINVYSDLNDWMDYTFKVHPCREDGALEILQRAFNAWHEDDQYVTMFEALEEALIEAGIPFESQINETEEGI